MVVKECKIENIYQRCTHPYVLVLVFGLQSFITYPLRTGHTWLLKNSLGQQALSSASQKLVELCLSK